MQTILIRLLWKVGQFQRSNPKIGMIMRLGTVHSAEVHLSIEGKRAKESNLADSIDE